jgi:hypothetical protein
MSVLDRTMALWLADRQGNRTLYSQVRDAALYRCRRAPVGLRTELVERGARKLGSPRPINCPVQSRPAEHHISRYRQ